MNILFVTESYWPNHDGGAVFEHRLVHQLSDTGHTVSVWAPGTTFQSYIQHDKKTVIYREKSKPFLFNARYRTGCMPWLKARYILQKTSPDVVHIHNPGGLGLASLFWAKRYKIPIVATNHLMPENVVMNIIAPGFIKAVLSIVVARYLTWFHNHCDYVISPTQTAAELLRRSGLTRHVEAITNGVNATEFSAKATSRKTQAAVLKKYHLDSKKVKILYLGRIDGEKRVDDIIRAFSLLPRDMNAQLVLAGRGKETSKLRHLAARKSVSDSVVFTGFVSDEDKPILYQVCDIFTIASPAELQSIVCLEAMASGLPLVAVDVAALSELCRHNENGFLFKANNHEQYARSLEKLVTDKSMRTKFGLHSRRIIEKEHTEDISLSKHAAVYADVIKNYFHREEKPSGLETLLDRFRS